MWQKHDKYTKDLGQSSLCQHKEKNFWLKMIFEQKQIRNMHESSLKDFLSKSKKSAKNALIMHNYAN